MYTIFHTNHLQWFPTSVDPESSPIKDLKAAAASAQQRHTADTSLQPMMVCLHSYTTDFVTMVEEYLSSGKKYAKSI